MFSKNVNRLLERQIRKYFGDLEQIPEPMYALFERINHSYDHYEGERELIERTLDLSSHESVNAYEKLRVETSRLRESEERLRLIAEALGEGLVIIGLDRRVQYVNPKFEDVTGYSKEFITGKIAVEILQFPDQWLEQEQRFHYTISGKPSRYEAQFKRADETMIWCEVHATPFFSMKGEIIGSIALFTDISSRKESEQRLLASESNLLALTSNTQDLIWSIDDNLLLRTCNPACSEHAKALMGIPAYPGMSVKEMHAHEQWGLWLDWYARALRGERFNIELNQDDAAQTIFALSFNPILNGTRVVGVAVFGKDVTESRKLMNELVEAKDRAEEMNHLKSAFLANMSHEIRTPMTAILGYSDLLLEDSTLSPNHQAFVKTIHKSANRLLVTINGILDLALIESNNLIANVKHVPLQPVIEGVMNTLNLLARSQGIQFDSSIQKGLLVETDAQFLHQILINIVGNAIKFTSKGSVLVKAKVHPSLPERVEICVEDTGIGIAPEFIPFIFEDFEQESTGYGRTHEGTGLGLSISKALAKKIGADIIVESEKGKGSIFRIVIPRVIEERSRNSSTKAEGFTLLLVEDSTETMELLRIILARPYRVESAHSAEEAVSMCGSSDYDGFVVDINLGIGASGYELVKTIRQIPRFRDAPILALTAYATTDEREEILHSGFDRYLSKPFSKTALLEEVNSMLSSKA